MSRAVPPRPGSGAGVPGDEELGRLIREGLRRDVDAPVDADRLASGARLGAVRIRHRRQAIVTSVAVLVLAVPTAVLGVRMLGGDQQAESTASGSGQGATPTGAGDQAAGPQAADGSAPAIGGVPRSALAAGGAASGAADSSAGAASVLPAPGATPAPTTAGGPPVEASPFAVPPPMVPGASASASASSAATARHAASPPVSVPPTALLGAADLNPPVLGLTSDSGAARSVPATAPSDTCGRPLAGLPAASAAARATVYERRAGATPGWLLGSTVRVYPGAGAAVYVQAAAGLACATVAPAGIGDGAALTRGQLDPQGRTHWYAVVRVGRAVSEVRLVVPRGGGAGASDLQHLVRLAAVRLTTSGLAASAAADPALDG